MIGIYTSNDRPFGCSIIYTDINSQYYFVHKHLYNAWRNQAHPLIWTPLLTIIASIVRRTLILYK